MQTIVGIEEYDRITLRLGQPGITGRRQPPIGLPNTAYLGIPGGDSGGVVRRTIVDDDDFLKWASLMQCTLDRLGQEMTVVVACDD
jgi:hypothetical protein